MTRGWNSKDKDLIGQSSWMPMLLVQFLMIGFITGTLQGLTKMIIFIAGGFSITFAGIFLDRWLAKRKTPPAIRIAQLCTAAALIASFALGLGLRVETVLAITLLVAVISGGITWAMWAWMGKKASVSQCARCEYETGPMDAMPDLCPECGANWHEPGGVVTERQERRPWMVVAGVVVAVIGFAVIFPGTTSLVAPVMPTSLLIRNVERATFVHDREWERLQGRQLSHDQQLKVVEALLDRRLAGRILTPAPQAWLDQIALTLPRDLQRRYFIEMIELALEIETIAGDERIQRTVVADQRGYSTMRMAYIVVGAVDVNGIREIPESSSLAFAHSLRERSPLPEAAGGGPRTVRQSVWLVVGPMAYFQSLPAREVTFDQDGTPILPQGADWVEEIELEWKRK